MGLTVLIEAAIQKMTVTIQTAGWRSFERMISKPDFFMFWVNF
jgi:hypothetical protein